MFAPPPGWVPTPDTGPRGGCAAMVGIVRRAVPGAALVVAVSLIGLAACEPQPPKPIDIYSFAGGCYALKDTTTGKAVVRDALGYTASQADPAKATPFTLQAT